MCFLTTVIKIKSNEEIANSIADVLFDEQDSNKDGTGAFCFNKENNVTYVGRIMRESREQILHNIENFDVVNYHFRNGTGGVKDETNVHFWKIGKWLFAHNGTASSFQQGEECDSLGLFKTMAKKRMIGENGFINIKKIKKFISDSTFWGRFILINSQNRRMYFFGDYHAYLLNKSYLVLASSICNFKLKKTLNVIGIKFEVDNEVEIETLEASLDGVISYSFQKGFIQIEDKLKEAYDYTKNWKKVQEKNAGKDDKSQDQKIEEYYAKGYGENYEEFGTNEYQRELQQIEATRDKIIAKVGTNYTKENMKLLEEAEQLFDWEVEELDDKFFGIKVPVKGETRELVPLL
jgi:hypothetical protein